MARKSNSKKRRKQTRRAASPASGSVSETEGPSAPERGGPERARPKRRSVDERPQPPWGNLPLAELLVIAGIVFGLWGFAVENAVMIVVGLALASIGGLEVTVREHFSGYRSHTTLLAALAGFATLLGVHYLFGAALLVSAIAAGVVLIAAFLGSREAFRRASGGYTVRIGKFRG